MEACCYNCIIHIICCNSYRTKITIWYIVASIIYCSCHRICNTSDFFTICQSDSIFCCSLSKFFNRFINYTGEIEYISELKELHFGELDGLPFSKYTTEQRELLEKIARHPSRARIREAETLREFHKRVKGVLKKLMDRHEDLVVFSHNGVIKTIFAELMKYGLNKDQLWMNLEFNYLAVLKLDAVYDTLSRTVDYKISLLPSVA